MDSIYEIVCLLLLGTLIILGMRNSSLKRRIQEADLSLSAMNEKYQRLENTFIQEKAEWKDQQRKRILRDIGFVNESPHIGNADAVDAVLKYSGDCFLSAKSVYDIKYQLSKVQQSVAYDSYINESIRPMLNEAELVCYSELLDCAKESILFHSDLDPRDILSQLLFYNERGWNKNEGILLEAIAHYYGSAMRAFTKDSYDNKSYLCEEEVMRILYLYMQKFYLTISNGGIDEIVHGHESSYRRSPDGLAKLFSHALFESTRVRTHLKVFDEERFYTSIV